MILSSARQLTEKERGCLEQFARFEISLSQLRFCLRRVMKFDFDAKANKGTRTMKTNFVVPEPGVLITKQDIEMALTRKEHGKLTEQQLVEWATMLLLNDAYEFDGKDEDFIAERLNGISFGTAPV